MPRSQQVTAVPSIALVLVQPAANQYTVKDRNQYSCRSNVAVERLSKRVSRTENLTVTAGHGGRQCLAIRVRLLHCRPAAMGVWLDSTITWAPKPLTPEGLPRCTSRTSILIAPARHMALYNFPIRENTATASIWHQLLLYSVRRPGRQPLVISTRIFRGLSTVPAHAADKAFTKENPEELARYRLVRYLLPGPFPLLSTSKRIVDPSSNLLASLIPFLLHDRNPSSSCSQIWKRTSRRIFFIYLLLLFFGRARNLDDDSVMSGSRIALNMQPTVPNCRDDG
ncbi:hypothetical protein BJX61DRAFT_229973 [Aspergillus egyptiacus]|nr:hypothetical protein BJX61DRAFT_229973 [Aspergillus egyptiacus]